MMRLRTALLRCKDVPRRVAPACVRRSVSTVRAWWGAVSCTFWRCHKTSLAYRSTRVRPVQATSVELGDYMLRAAYRTHGHAAARLDPLGLKRESVRVPEIDEALAQPHTPALAAMLAETYTQHIGAEFQHCESAEERAWWAAQLEERAPRSSPTAAQLSVAQKRNMNLLLQQAEAFELFLARKFVSFKRYSGEGTESMIPALDAMFMCACAHGCDEAVLGMAHRGRLALQVGLLGYPVRALVHKILGNSDIPAAVQGIDDVSSHICVHTHKTYMAGATPKRIAVSMLPNPSHLEAVNPVVLGKARAKLDQGARDVLSVLIHGDAAVSGQGVVAETYAMTRLPGYAVRGTVHLITNNQIGFTSEESNARSSAYASDMAKVVGAPVLHVNAESLRDVVLASQLAVEYRQRFGKDVVVDLIGFRRHGHNEVDAPEFTQPLMYKAIRARASFASLFAEQLQREGIMTPEAHAALHTKLSAHLEAEFEAAKAFTAATGSMGLPTGGIGSGTHVVGNAAAYGGKWAHMRQAEPQEMHESPDTGVSTDLLRQIGAASVRSPSEIRVHDRLVRSHIQARLEAVGVAKDGATLLPEFDSAARTIDWATSEALAFGSLLHAGHDVRLSGQDSQRGTFSQRHATLTCQASGTRCVPLNGIVSDQTAKLTVVSSFLSEFAVMGFEFGYAWESPRSLVLWEAQFGDFANGAQIIIDQFLSGSESKWLRANGLVLLLPHGYDGAGPEHSSARIERFLQLVNSQGVAGDAPFLAERAAVDKSIREACNMIVANPTTPANYFHLLRRQIVRPFRKPLVVIAPKTLLRHPQAVSSLSEMAPASRFQPILQDTLATPGAAPSVSRVVLVSGKLYFELAKRRADIGAHDVALLRIEELAPFPTSEIMAHIAKTYPAVKAVTWCQEEPANAGAWQWAEAHLRPHLRAAGLPDLRYVGRPALAAPAVGLGKHNKLQQDYVLETCLPHRV